MRYFTAILHKEDASSWGLSFLDAPGCFSAADEWSDLPAAAAEALDLWFEDQPMVEPAPFEEIRKSPEVVDALARGGALILIPYTPGQSGPSAPCIDEQDAED